MMDLNTPSINVVFKKAAETANSAENNGILAMILTEESVEEPAVYYINSVNDIPTGLTEINKGYIERALLGNDAAPKKIILYVGTDISEGLSQMEKYNFSWIVGPVDINKSDTTTFATWVKGRWEAGQYCRAVLPNEPADHPAIVNLAEDTFKLNDGTTLKASEYCSRIAGLICGTQASKSITYAVLSELIDVTAKSKNDIDTALKAGKLVLFNDGEKVKVSRGVTSLTTATETFSDAYKKIKLVNIICTIQNDLTRLVADYYIGKYANTYDNKCALIAAIEDYFSGIASEELIENTSSADIDIEAQRSWLVASGNMEAASWTSDKVKRANTGSKVFIKASISMLDAVEDVQIVIEY